MRPGGGRPGCSLLDCRAARVPALRRLGRDPVHRPGRPGPRRAGGLEFRVLDDLAPQAGEDITQLALEFEAHVIVEAAERLTELERKKILFLGALGHHVNHGLVNGKVTELGPHCPPHASPPAPP